MATPFETIATELKKRKENGIPFFQLRKELSGKFFGNKEAILAMTPEQQKKGIDLITSEVGFLENVVQRAFNWTVLDKREQNAPTPPLDFGKIANKAAGRKQFYAQNQIERQVYAELASHRDNLKKLTEDEKTAGFQIISDKAGIPMERLTSMQLSIEGKMPEKSQQRLDFETVAKNLHAKALALHEQAAKYPDVEFDVQKTLYGQFSGYVQKYSATLPTISAEEIAQGTEHGQHYLFSNRLRIDHFPNRRNPATNNNYRSRRKHQHSKHTMRGAEPIRISPIHHSHIIMTRTRRMRSHPISRKKHNH